MTVSRKGNGAQTWRRPRNVHVLLHVRVARQLPSPGDDRHAVGTRPKRASEYGLQRVVLLCRCEELGLLTSARNMDAGRGDRETPIPCAYGGALLKSEVPNPTYYRKQNDKVGLQANSGQHSANTLVMQMHTSTETQTKLETERPGKSERECTASSPTRSGKPRCCTGILG